MFKGFYNSKRASFSVKLSVIGRLANFLNLIPKSGIWQRATGNTIIFAYCLLINALNLAHPVPCTSFEA